jgi:hypothetical protein
MKMEAYENLANAIILKSVDDYIEAIRKLHHLLDNKWGVICNISEREEKKVKPMHYTGGELVEMYDKMVVSQRTKIKSIEKFFYSDWFGVLTKVDAKKLLDGVKQQIKDKYNIDCDLL